MTKQTAYDFFLASLSMEIIETQAFIGFEDAGSMAHQRLLDRHTHLQRLLAALDEIADAVPDEEA